MVRVRTHLGPLLASLAVATVGAITGCGDDGTAASREPAESSADPSTVTPDTTDHEAAEARVDVGAESTEPSGTADPQIAATLPWAPTELWSGSAQTSAPTWSVEIVATTPHDPTAFTQGLEVHDGVVYESTGLTGESTVRTLDIESGEVISVVDVDDDVFAEGLTVSGDRVIQLTWQSGLAYVRDAETLAPVGQYSYDGEGWGICRDGDHLVMSDGSAALTYRDPSTFDVLGVVDVGLDGEPVPLLNELECVDGYVLANVWSTDTIVVIDPDEGRVVATVDASTLTVDAIGPDEDTTRVLNGIARLDDDTFLLTGKLWPSMYQVRFVAG